MQSNVARAATPRHWGEYSEFGVMGRSVREAIYELLSRAAQDAAASDVIVHRGTRFRAHTLVLTPRSPVTVVLVCEEDSLPTDRVIAKRFGLTRRETEVARLLAQRLSNKEIAKKLGLAPNTVWRHTDSVLGKLGVSTRRHVLDVLRRV